MQNSFRSLDLNNTEGFHEGDDAYLLPSNHVSFTSLDYNDHREGGDDHLLVNDYHDYNIGERVITTRNNYNTVPQDGSKIYSHELFDTTNSYYDNDTRTKGSVSKSSLLPSYLYYDEDIIATTVATRMTVPTYNYYQDEKQHYHVSKESSMNSNIRIHNKNNDISLQALSSALLIDPYDNDNFSNHKKNHHRELPFPTSTVVTGDKDTHYFEPINIRSPLSLSNNTSALKSYYDDRNDSHHNESSVYDCYGNRKSPKKRYANFVSPDQYNRRQVPNVVSLKSYKKSRHVATTVNYDYHHSDSCIGEEQVAYNNKKLKLSDNYLSDIKVSSLSSTDQNSGKGPIPAFLTIEEEEEMILLQLEQCNKEIQKINDSIRLYDEISYSNNLLASKRQKFGLSNDFLYDK